MVTMTVAIMQKMNRTVICNLSVRYICALNSKCITFNCVCNWINDCSDNLDEYKCPPPTCLEVTFQSINGKCLNNELFVIKKMTVEIILINRTVLRHFARKPSPNVQTAS